jgi:hypothetical protein
LVAAGVLVTQGGVVRVRLGALVHVGQFPELWAEPREELVVHRLVEAVRAEAAQRPVAEKSKRKKRKKRKKELSNNERWEKSIAHQPYSYFTQFRDIKNSRTIYTAML